MTRLVIVKYPKQVLMTKAQEVKEVTPEIVRLMDDMTETMYAEEGVGLAAPQVDVSKRVIVIDTGVELPGGGKGRHLIQMANPVIVSSSGEVSWEEGCLSVPGLRVTIKRRERLVIMGLGRTGKEIELVAEGLLAIAFQHEIDHLDGRLIIDRASGAVREKYINEISGKVNLKPLKKSSP